MNTAAENLSHENSEKPKNPFTILDEMLINKEYRLLNYLEEEYKLWFHLEYREKDSYLNFFIRHCEAEPKYERFIADLRNKKGNIKSLLWYPNVKLAKKKYAEFIRFKEEEFMDALKETSRRVDEIIDNRRVFYDDLKEIANSITIKVKEKTSDDE